MEPWETAIDEALGHIERARRAMAWPKRTTKEAHALLALADAHEALGRAEAAIDRFPD